MRRPAPPPPSEVVELDYGSAETPSASDAKQHVRGNEVEATAAAAVAASSATVGRGRKLLAYDTDAFDDHAPSSSNSKGENKALNASQDFSYGFVQHEISANAVGGPSSPRRQHAESIQPQQDVVGGTDAGVPSHADLWLSGSAQHPPPPDYPPPVLPQSSDPHGAAHHAYDPNAPEFRPSLQPPAPPMWQPESELYYSASAPQGYHAAPEGSYAQPAGLQAMPAAYEQPYDPQAPYHPFLYTGPPHDFAHTPYPPALASYPGYHPPNIEYSYAGGVHPQMAHFHDKRMLKQQKKKEKKLRKREKKQAARSAAYAAYYAPHDLGSSSSEINAYAYDEDVAWIEDGKAQALAMIKELHERGVPPQRLTERGVPLHMIEACCVELGISAQGSARQEMESTPIQQPTIAPDGAEQKAEGGSTTTPAEDELLAKQEQGIALTPLEELRRKVLASRLAKAAPASTEASPAPAKVVAPENTAAASSSSTVPSVFDRTATSGEADTLLSQIGESIRGLIRPSHELWNETQPEAPFEDAPTQPASASSRKRAYRDVDAVDHENGSAIIDYTGGADAPVTIPNRRQRISYADTFSRAAEMPSGEVDLTAPVLDLPDLTESVAESSRVTDAVSKRARPVAADFDTAEYSPQYVRPNRFLDVPSGLNTVVDLSDDDTEEDEMVALEEAIGWKAAQLDIDMRDVLLLRQRTATEHYDTFCALNGLKPVGRSLTPLQDSPAKAVQAAEVLTPGGSVSKESVLFQVAASSAASLGTSTPSREDLLRKELEIKQLMRKIQMMEERKSKQQAATPSPAGSPIPSRHLAHGNGSQDRPINAAASSRPSEFSKALAAAVHDRYGSKELLREEESDAQQQSVPTSSKGGMRLDPALQKQRETLLALLASKRKNADAGQSQKIAKQDDTASSKQQDPNSVADSSGASAEDNQTEALVERKELSPPPSTVSRYRPVVPSLFQSVASRVRSYLPPLRWAVASSSSEERTSVKWCTREADGGECGDARCSQRHVREFD